MGKNTSILFSVNCISRLWIKRNFFISSNVINMLIPTNNKANIFCKLSSDKYESYHLLKTLRASKQQLILGQRETYTKAVKIRVHPEVICTLR